MIYPLDPSVNQIHRTYRTGKKGGGKTTNKRDKDSHRGCLTGRSDPVAPVDMANHNKSVHLDFHQRSNFK